MGPKLAGKLLSNITSHLAHTVGTCVVVITIIEDSTVVAPRDAIEHYLNKLESVN